MDAPLFLGFRFTRVLLAGCVFIICVSIMLQLDMPTFQGMGSRVNSELILHKLALANPKREDYLKMGWTYYGLGRFDNARRMMAKVMASENNMSALYCLGLIDFRYRDFDAGINKLETVANFSPGHVPTRMALGQAYFELKYYAKAQRFFAEVIDLEPANQEARLWLGKTMLKMNQKEAALEMIETVINGHEAVEAQALMKDLARKPYYFRSF